MVLLLSRLLLAQNFIRSPPAFIFVIFSLSSNFYDFDGTRFPFCSMILMKVIWLTVYFIEKGFEYPWHTFKWNCLYSNC